MGSGATARSLSRHFKNGLFIYIYIYIYIYKGSLILPEEYKDIFQASHGAKLGFQSPFFLASAYALKQIPALNAYIDNSTNEIVYRDYINIGFAAATPKGLVTPVIKNLETKNLAEASFT